MILISHPKCHDWPLRLYPGRINTAACCWCKVQIAQPLSLPEGSALQNSEASATNGVVSLACAKLWCTDGSQDVTSVVVFSDLVDAFLPSELSVDRKGLAYRGLSNKKRVMPK